MRHAMIDIETLGTRPGSVILQAACVLFDRTGAKGHLCVSLPIDSQYEIGMTEDPETVIWWSDPARIDLLQGIMLREGDVAWSLQYFFDCIRQEGEIDGWWANDPAFDLIMLEVLAHKVGVKVPWNHRNRRCLRTALELAGYRKCSDVLPTPEGAHHALADAIYQSRVAGRVLERIERWHSCAVSEDCE